MSDIYLYVLSVLAIAGGVAVLLPIWWAIDKISGIIRMSCRNKTGADICRKTGGNQDDRKSGTQE